MPNPEFWYQELPSATTLVGPGVTLAFNRASGVVHSLRMSTTPERPGEGGAAQPLVLVHALDANLAAQSDPAQILHPVYQDLVLHELPMELGPGLCMLLTGSCYDHHFSAVFSLYRDRKAPGRVVLDVDVADRCRSAITKLAATYDVEFAAAPGILRDMRPLALTWQFGPPGEATLEFLALGPATIGEPAGNRVQADATIDRRIHTQRLRYQWRWTSCGDLT